MKRFALFCLLFVPMCLWAQKQYFLPTGDSSMDEKDRPMIEVYLPQKEKANGCAVVLCPGGAMRWLSWESDVVKMAAFLNEHGIAAIGLRYHLNKGGGGGMPRGAQMPPMVDVTHPDHFPQADANPMHNAHGDSIIHLAEQDAKAAIKMVREHAEEWNINKDKIGYLGFSAGGGVAIAATMSATAIERPNFLCTKHAYFALKMRDGLVFMVSYLTIAKLWNQNTRVLKRRDLAEYGLLIEEWVGD